MREEPWLTRPNKTKEVLRKYGFHFQKKFGQNFLLDSHVLEKIIAAADIGRDDFVIEIGPGIGTLTQYLSYYAGNVAAVEIDKNLIPILEDTLQDWDNVEIISGDIMKMDLRKLIDERSGGRKVKFVANLPYYITTPILMRLLEEKLPVSSITVMVQKEVAERMQAGPGSKDYGALSAAVQYYSEPGIAANVPANCFIPRPNVGSAVINLRIKPEEERVKVNDEELMFHLIKAAFGQRRKTMLNALKNDKRIPYNKEQILEAMISCGLPENIRGEALALEQYAALADALA
ncbi:MAG TPA: 16S rRNA (adenine(1518)-N(6)/adenine(1519)-N(6))-dimethyltransferase [Lachnospiraceae bacterium]|nr:16S rRNA (adenine(1518)-N(6)/adenine(1519)-N(6))-dimethyltransferase [Lachnospiraceae bacterium]